MFRIGDACVDVLADRSRVLPVVDPVDRALIISCGAAVGLLEVAARRFGLLARIVYQPETREPDLLARVHFTAGEAPAPKDLALFGAITRRRTNRTAFVMEPLATGFVQDIPAIAATTGIEIAILTDIADRTALAGLVAEGDRCQFADPQFRRELGAWVHSKQLGSRDGMSGASFGMPDILSAVGGIVIRTFDMGNGIAAADEAKILSGTPALLVFASAEAPRGWINTGRALGQVTLLATAAGLATSYLNQPIETEALRPRVKAAAGLKTEPQIVLRVGKAKKGLEPTARRDLSDVIVD
jgi:hypothetical protein